jgi:hypothetical protein
MTEADLIESAHAWDQAMVDNDAAAIGRFIADEWTIVGPDGSVNGKTGFLSLIASGDLTHDVMTSEDLTVRVYGETGIVVAKGISAGHLPACPSAWIDSPTRSTKRYPRRQTYERTDSSWIGGRSFAWKGNRREEGPWQP